MSSITPSATPPPTASSDYSWTSFLKSIASFNGDLSSLTAPPFILSPTSLTEYSQYWAEHPDLFVDADLIKTSPDASKEESEAMALKRMISVTRWFISTLKSQYCSRNETMGSEKKPLNPFLGEVFVGKWECDDTHGEAVCLSEQVSHHPPVTAYAIKNKKHNVTLQGYNGITSSISTTSINIKQFGHAILEFQDSKESYLITLPPLHIEGLITAAPFVELEGKSFIQSSNGFFAVVEYTGRGWISGKKNTFKSRIYRDQFASINKDNALVTIGGQWSGKSYIIKGNGNPTSKDELFYDAAAVIAQHLTVKPIEKQHELESRRAWYKVAEAIKLADYNLIHQEKSLIENKQRELRKQEREAGITWENRWFELVDYDQLKEEHDDDKIHDSFINLTNLANLSIRNAPSGSLKQSKYDTGAAKHWRFSLKKWAAEKDIVV